MTLGSLFLAELVKPRDRYVLLYCHTFTFVCVVVVVVELPVTARYRPSSDLHLTSVRNLSTMAHYNLIYVYLFLSLSLPLGVWLKHSAQCRIGSA